MKMRVKTTKEKKPRFLVLGAKEYPLGANKSEDAFASGGMEAYTQQLAPRLARRGARVIVVTRKFSGQPARETRDGVEVVRVGWLRGFLLRNPSFNANALRETLFMPRGAFNVVIANGVIATLAGLKTKFFRRLAGERVRVIARPAGVAWVQPQYNALVKLALLLLETLAYKLADAVVFLSPQEREQFKKKMGFAPKRAVLIPTGVDAARFQRASRSRGARERVRKQLGLNKNGKQRCKLVVFVGRLMRVKGLEHLIRAMPSVEAKLLIVGGGPLRGELEELARERGAADKIVFWERAEIPEVLAAADAFVLPSLSEGLPLALLEAMAAKRACVVTDIGLPARDGVDALVVPPKNSGALAKAINEVLSNEKLRRKLGENAFARVKKEFNWENAVEKYLELAKQVAND